MHLDLANNTELQSASLGNMPMSSVRMAEVEGWVDTGAAHLVLPKTIVDRLGLPVAGQTKATLADGTVRIRDYVKQVWLSMGGRDGVFKAIVEPNREDALIGAIVLEDLDMVADPVTGQCIPRHPDVMIAELGGPQYEMGSD